MYGFRNWNILGCIAMVILSCTIISTSANTNLIRPKRHVGVFFKHLQPIIENPEVFHDADVSETTVSPDNSMDVTTASPNGKDTDATDTPGTGKPAKDEENKGTSPSDAPNSQNMTAETTPIAQDKLAKDDTVTDSPSQTSPSSSDSENPTQQSVPDDNSAPSATSSPSDEAGKTATDTGTTIQPESKEDVNSPSDASPASVGDSTSSPSPAPGSSPESSTDSSEPQSVAPVNETGATETPETQTVMPDSQDDSSAQPDPTNTNTNARKPKTLSDESPTEMPLSDEMSSATNPSTDPESDSQTPAVPAETPVEEKPSTDSPDSDSTTPAICSPSGTSGSPEPKSENIDSSAPTTSSASPEAPTTPSTTSASPEEKDEEEEDLEAIAQLLDKLNAQKKLLDEQIADSKKSLESITDVLNNDKNRKINDVIDRVNEEEVKPLAEVLNEDTSAYDRVLDPAVVTAYAANDTVRGQTKQWIIARIVIPAQFQLMQSYLCVKMVSPDVNFQQRLGMIGLFTETHVDCLRNRQHELRAPLEAMIVRLTCITKCTDPGKIPNSWQPNNYLNRGAMEQIRECNQPDAFYATNPLGSNTLAFRTIQNDYQNGVETFQNIQRNFAQQMSLANQEVGRMQQGCERQRQQQLAREQVPQVPANAYLPAPAPADSRWNTPQASSPVPAMALPSGQWYVGQWRPSLPSDSYSAPRWSRQV